MAKDKDIEIKKPGGAIAPLSVEGDTGDSPLSYIVLYQGTAEEQQMYGDGFKRGDFIDVLEKRSLGQSIKVVPVAGFMSWARFEKGQRAPVYATRCRDDVPPADLNWSGPDMKTPPAAVECVNLVMAVDGEPWPYLFRFKRTGLGTYNKVLAPLQKRRQLSGKGAGLFELFSIDDKNPEGKPFKRLSCKGAGDPSSDLLALAATFQAEWNKLKVKAEKLDDTHAEPDDGAPV